MNNKLFEMLDKLDSFVTTEEIGIDFIEVYNGKNELQIDIFSVPNNSFKFLILLLVIYILIKIKIVFGVIVMKNLEMIIERIRLTKYPYNMKMEIS